MLQRPFLLSIQRRHHDPGVLFRASEIAYLLDSAPQYLDY